MRKVLFIMWFSIKSIGNQPNFLQIELIKQFLCIVNDCKKTGTRARQTFLRNIELTKKRS